MAVLMMMAASQATALQVSPYVLRIGDVRGSYTIPYIQAGRSDPGEAP